MTPHHHRHKSEEELEHCVAEQISEVRRFNMEWEKRIRDRDYNVKLITILFFATIIISVGAALIIWLVPDYVKDYLSCFFAGILVGDFSYKMYVRYKR